MAKEVHGAILRRSLRSVRSLGDRNCGPGKKARLVQGFVSLESAGRFSRLLIGAATASSRSQRRKGASPDSADFPHERRANPPRRVLASNRYAQLTLPA